MSENYRMIALTLAMSMSLVGGTQGDQRGCSHCNCDCACEKVCRLVCEEKKVNITCWGCKCEDFCLPGPSQRGCLNCEEVCDDCDSPVHAEPKRFVWYDWLPGCSQGVVTKKKLMRKTVTKTIPSYKWVVEDLCPDCQSNCQNVTIPAGTKLPPAPAVPGAKVIGARAE